MLITTHLTENNIMSNAQWGFSTVTALLDTTHRWFEILEKGNNIFFDYCKAFDLVLHRPLLSKLSLDAIIVRWVADYLTFRQQRVAINRVTSDYTSVLSGGPQGSVLGPLLFLICVDDLESLSMGVGSCTPRQIPHNFRMNFSHLHEPMLFSSLSSLTLFPYGTHFTLNRLLVHILSLYMHHIRP